MGHITLEADLVIYQLQEAAASLPKLLLQKFQLSVIERAVQVEACRSLVAIYDWLCNAGPSLMQRLFDIHQSENGAVQELTEKFPEYALAVNHVFLYVKTYVALHAKVPNRMPPSWVKPLHGQEKINSKALLKELSRIPAAFFGIVDTHSKGTIPLGTPQGRMSWNHSYVYEASQRCLMDALSKQLLLDPMSKIDKVYSHSGGTRIYNENDVQSRCVARGVILHTLADICQTENIFASSSISTLLVSLMYMLADSPNIHKPSKFVATFMSNRENYESLCLHKTRSYTLESMKNSALFSYDKISAILPTVSNFFE